jgi:hypothetical protein
MRKPTTDLTSVPTTLMEALEHPAWEHNLALEQVAHQLAILGRLGAIGATTAGDILNMLPKPVEVPNLDKF